MTESEAKTKWCPFARTGAFTDRGPMMAVTTNRDPRPDVQSSCNCIASDCMAWVEIKPTKEGFCQLINLNRIA